MLALRELTLAILSTGAGVLASSLHAIRRPFRGGRRRVLLAGTNLLMARDLSRVRQVLEDDAAVSFRTTLRPWTGAPSVAPAEFSLAVGAPFVSWTRSLLMPWDLVCVASHARAFLAGRQVPKVYVGHGISGWKRIDGVVDSLAPRFTIRHGRNAYTRIFMRGPDGMEMARREHPRLVGSVAIVGDIIADEILELDRRRMEIREEWGIAPGQLTVGVLSTHGPEGLIGHYGARLLRALERLATLHRVLVVNHPFNIYNRAFPDIQRISTQLYNAPPAGVRVNAHDEPIGPALVAADLVITDHTSTALYFAQLGRPVIPLAVPSYPPNPGSPFWRICQFAPIASNPETFEDAVRRSREGYPLDRLREVAQAVLACPGEARARWRAELRTVLGLDASTPPRIER